MSRTFVALDLETTGLQKEQDAIIEIGAVKFRIPRTETEEPVIDTWSTLVNPRRPLRYRIQKLTGISQAELDSAPPIGQVIIPLSRFVGDLPVIGHNVAFDLGFLRKQNALSNNVGIDTFELAGILIPYATSYSLGRLAEQLSIPFPTRHRALEDALMTKDLFLSLLQRARKLDLTVIREVNRLASRTNWPLAPVMREVERSRARYAFTDTTIGQQLQDRIGGGDQPWGLRMPSRPLKRLEPSEQVTPLNQQALTAQLEHGGLFANHLPGFEERPQQVQMLNAVVEAFNRQQHLLVEAGTGTGKSLAYLLPAVHFAAANGRPVVISTNTINLQDQLVHKDLPDLERILDMPFEATMLKGRSNYLCPRRLDMLRQSTDIGSRDMTTLAKLLVWQRSTTTGDQSELTLVQQRGEFAFWRKVCVDADACQPDICRHEQEGRCFFYNARRRAEAAHIIVVNHALLLADMMTENRVLPEHHHLIIDEAHHLEAQATRQLGNVLNLDKIEQLLREISQAKGVGQYAGFLSNLHSQVDNSQSPAHVKAQLQDLIRLAHQEIAGIGPRLYGFFNALRRFLDDRAPKKGNYDVQIRLIPALRVQPGWTSVEIAWDDLGLRLKQIAQSLEQIYRPLELLDNAGITEYEDLVQTLGGYHQHVLDYWQHLEGVISQPAANTIYWATIKAKDNDLELHNVPLHVGNLLAQGLFGDKDTVVLTSATVQVDGSFSFLQDRLGLEGVRTLSVGSPFDFAKSTLLYLPTDIPEPNTPGYARAVQQTLIDLCQATGGRTLVLFTSKSQLRATYDAISDPLGEKGINVLSQYRDGSRRQLLEDFRAQDRTVLLGTHSFWEGIDVPGPALSCVVIARLPFPVPSDPVFATRSETYDNPFVQFAVPQTVLRFRQGFGRLIRRRTDRGTVIVLDRRVLTKRYGQYFVRSLPACKVRKAPAGHLPETAVRWIEGVGNDGR